MNEELLDTNAEAGNGNVLRKKETTLWKSKRCVRQESAIVLLENDHSGMYLSNQSFVDYLPIIRTFSF